MNLIERKAKRGRVHPETLLRDDRGRKRCRVCRDWKSESEYAKCSRNADQLRAWCRACSSSYAARWRHGLQGGWREATLAAQGGVCAICESPDPRGTAWCVDHDHKCCPGERGCGKCVRAVLCNGCNKGIGLLGDDPSTLRAAADYLERHAI